MMNTLPTVKQAYSATNWEESQREMVTGINNADSTAFFSNNHKANEKTIKNHSIKITLIWVLPYTRAQKDNCLN